MSGNTILLAMKTASSLANLVRFNLSHPFLSATKMPKRNTKSNSNSIANYFGLWTVTLYTKYTILATM